MAVRVISAYRTVSREAAAVLAGIMPFEILTEKYAIMYQRYRSLYEEHGFVTPKVRRIIKRETERAVGYWKSRLEDLGPEASGSRVLEAIVPRLEEWLTRTHRGQLIFRTTQIITGHGCFNWYLYNIQHALTPLCAHCRVEMDTAQQTLAGCPA